MNGKGDASRPATINEADLQARWEATFRQTPMRTFAPAVDVGGMATADGQIIPAGTMGHVIHEIGGLPAVAEPDAKAHTAPYGEPEEAPRGAGGNTAT